MKKGVRWCFCLIAWLALLQPLAASPQEDVLLLLRFYEGARGPKPTTARVVTAYSLRPLFIGNFISEKSLLEEEAELKRVFNLSDLAVLAQAQWGWEGDRTEKRFQLLVLNGHEFLLQVVKQPQPDTFRVQVIDQGAVEKTALLDSELVLPAGKSSVFGFEDSLAQPFFLAVQRRSGTAAVSESGLQPVPFRQTDRVPKLLNKVDPVYPEKLRNSGATASIALQMDVDEQGKVWRVKAFSRDDEFVKAAVDAISQWRVEPLVVDGKAQPQTFTCSVNFLRGGVALDFSAHAPLSPQAEPLLRKIRALGERLLGQKYKAEKITLQFKEESLAAIVPLLSKVSGIPILADPDISEKLDIDLRPQPWDHALARLLDLYGLDIAVIENGLRLYRPFQACWPAQGYLTSIFGKRRNPLTKKEDFHNGIDIAAKVGTPVVSSAAGLVTASEFRNKQGHVITIDHGRGFSSSYFFLASRRVAKGAVVAQGETIGTVGSFAGGTGPHLHFEIRVNGELRNPADFMSPTNKKVK